ncbi:P-loop containing nucleoside triphosphate hydrolase protein [Mycena capillaripes]|nr:P-loop containing nucleoside triphosphate hydrolase protein [Mycena capillaripes]
MDTFFKTLRDYSKARLDILKQLRDAGIEPEVELPQIVAVGNQSVGKSSLMEAISTFRSNLSDLNEIRGAIGDAQERILNPSLIGRSTAVTQKAGARTFSEDCVCVFAKGPDMHDLYFYDIPGVIHDVRDAQDSAQIDLINNLVKKYVAKPHCIVLLVVSCGYDIEIGGVARLIFTGSDPELKARTVGVLTKADKIDDPEEFPTWLDTFNNKARKLDNGWFAVKLPAGGDIEWKVAREQEREFFENKEPWRSIRGEDRNRLGSEQLTQYISKQLSKLVADRLPVISRKITMLMKEWEAELKRLPRNPERDAFDTIRTVIRKFDEDFSAHIQGISPEPFTTNVGLVYQVKEVYDSIRQGVSQHTPRFCPTSAPDDEASPGSSPAWAQLCAEGEIVYLDKIVEYLNHAVTRELPGELPYGITPRIITHYVKGWKAIAIEKFSSVQALADEHFNALIQGHFGEYKRGDLLSSVREILKENLDYCEEATTVELDGLAAMELVPSTVLKTEYVVLQTTIYQHYQTQLASHETSLLSAAADVFAAFLGDNSATIAGELARGVISAATRENFAQKFAPTKERGQHATADKDRHNALIVMSRAQAYLELASNRFAEVAANCIDHSFLRQLGARVGNALRALPANTSPEICLKLIQDPAAVEQRREATEKRNHYARIKNILDDAKRNLEGDTPGLGAYAGSQHGASDSRPRISSDSGPGFPYTPLSVDCSSTSLTDIDVDDSE